jgi:rfaE bifunctional protein kinase chain/domain
MSRAERLRGARVLVLGDLMLDEYLWGDVHRISPEAPVPVVAIQRTSHVAGGAANVAVGVRALDGTARLGGVVGDDAAGRALRGELEPGIDLAGIYTDPDRRTTTKTRVIAHAQQMLRTDVEDTRPVGEAAGGHLLGWLREAVADADALVVSDYMKGAITEPVAREVMAIASAAGVPTVVDSKARDYARWRGATVLTPNQHDAGRAANVDVDSEEALEHAVGRLQEICGQSTAVLVTRGSSGMTLFGRDGNAPVHVHAEARDVYDVTGAGDTVVAVLAVALGRGLDLEEAVRLANRAAGIVVGKLGTSTVSVDELARSLG